MFDRFTDPARKVLGYARLEAQRLNHEYIGTVHILLGLVREGSGVTAAVFKQLEVELRKVRLEVEKLVTTGQGAHSTAQLPFTPRAKKVLELTRDAADDLGHEEIGTEHLLLGILGERETTAARVLRGLGLARDDVRRAVLARIDPGGERGATEA